MGPIANHPRTLDVSALPNVVFGHRALVWWGTVGLMILEGLIFAILMVAYFYLRVRAPEWPVGARPPELLFGTLNTALYAASLFPNYWIKRVARQGNQPAVRFGLVIMTLVGLGNLIVRGFELTALNCRWDANAYGSVVWVLLGFHTAHLVTDWLDTAVFMVLFFQPVDGKRFVEASENADYWYFVVLAWLPIYGVLYWAPRWM
jgi:heme/copper-type cytochrome/quinol oxidase subunit 3